MKIETIVVTELNNIGVCYKDSLGTGLTSIQTTVTCDSCFGSGDGSGHGFGDCTKCQGKGTVVK